jgi:probable F420-dependent oxidoreductase
MAVNLGQIGIWSGPSGLTAELAVDVEKLGYGAIWVGGSPPEDLGLVETLLDATSTITVATGIVNMWTADPGSVARSYHRLAAKHPGRFLLGVGIGHPEVTRQYQKPHDTIVSYLDELDEAGVPVEDRALAALGPRVLELARTRTACAHPYLTTPEHTRWARDLLGSDVLLAPELKVVLDTDPDRARRRARQGIRNPYLGLANYRNNLIRLGWSDEDLDDGGTDSLIDALAAHGDAATIAKGVRAHLDAGADHVGVQVLPADTDPLPVYQALADALR